MRLSNIVATSLLLAGFGTAHAQYRCDCTSVVDTCSAEVVARGTFLEIKTDHQMCARVDYFVDGQPFVSVVVDGEDREDWLARTTNPRILVQSCQVCRDTRRERPLPPRPRERPRRPRPAQHGRGGRRRRPRAADLRCAGVSGSRASARAARLRRGRVHRHSAGHGREPARRLGRAAQRVRLGGSRGRRAPPLSRGRRARAASR